MDTRKLIAHIDGDSGDAGRIEQHGYGIIGSVAGAGAIDILPELVKRWNCYHDLIRQLDNLLCQLEDTGGVTKADIAEARDLLVRMGYGYCGVWRYAGHQVVGRQSLSPERGVCGRGHRAQRQVQTGQ